MTEYVRDGLHFLDTEHADLRRERDESRNQATDLTRELDEASRQAQGWRAQAYFAHKRLSRLLRQDLNVVKQDAENKLENPTGEPEEFTGSRADWTRILITELEAALLRQRERLADMESRGEA